MRSSSALRDFLKLAKFKHPVYCLRDDIVSAGALIL
jgi:hypothetical protein